MKNKIKKVIRKRFYKIFPELHRDFSKSIKNSEIGEHCKVYPKARILNSQIGNYTYISENSSISNTSIGKFCSIGPNVIFGWGIHPTNGISTHPMFYSKRKQNGMTLSQEDKIEERLPIVIGNDVFIGMNVVVLDGVSIGDGAVIGAGAVVSKDIPPYAIAVGNPIHIISYRFEDSIIKELTNLKWWESPDQLNLVEKHFFDVESYLKTIQDLKK